MPENSGFRVYPTPHAKQQIRQMLVEAQTAGSATALTSAWMKMLLQLEQDPESFGEPRFSTKLPGGMVYHRVFERISVHYAVYPQPRVVYVMDVGLMQRPS